MHKIDSDDISLDWSQGIRFCRRHPKKIPLHRVEGCIKHMSQITRRSLKTQNQLQQFSCMSTAFSLWNSQKNINIRSHISNRYCKISRQHGQCIQQLHLGKQTEYVLLQFDTTSPLNSRTSATHRCHRALGDCHILDNYKICHPCTMPLLAYIIQPENSTLKTSQKLHAIDHNRCKNTPTELFAKALQHLLAKWEKLQ